MYSINRYLTHSIPRLTKRSLPALVLAALFLALLPSCKSDDDKLADQYAEWKETNDAYVARIAAQVDEQGNPLYRVIDPVWAPGTISYARWLDDLKVESDNDLKPMDTSTVNIYYTLSLADGTVISEGTKYTTQPYRNIPGFQAILTRMNVGDTVQAVIPYTAGYGAVSNNDIPPYSTLIYGIRLNKILGYEIKH